MERPFPDAPRISEPSRTDTQKARNSAVRSPVSDLNRARNRLHPARADLRDPHRSGRSWFIILFFVIFFLSGSFKNALADSSDTVAYVTAVASAMLFFASLILHELG
jgi:hypothetical protein